MGSESPPSGGNDALLQSWKGGASRQIQSNAANVTGDSVGLCFFSWGPNCVFMQVPKDSRACSHHVLKRISGVSSKTHLLKSKHSYFLSHNRKEVLVAFLWSLLSFCACLFASPGIHAGQVPGCSYLFLAVYVPWEPWMLGSSVLCRPHSCDREIG